MLDPVRDLDVPLPFRIGSDGDVFRVPMGYFEDRYIEQSRASQTPIFYAIRLRFWFSDLSYEPKAGTQFGWDAYPDPKYSDRQGYDKSEDALIYFFIKKVGFGRDYVPPCQKAKNRMGSNFLDDKGYGEGNCETGGEKIFLDPGYIDEKCEYYRSIELNQIITSCSLLREGVEHRSIFVDTSADERGYYYTIWLKSPFANRIDEVESKIAVLINRTPRKTPRVGVGDVIR
ncbi:hypothetical protein, partial [Elstera cyanobacteriorum]